MQRNLSVLLREHGPLAGGWSEALGVIVNCTVLGEIPDLQGSSVWRRHQEGFPEDIMGAIEIGPSLRAASVQVSQLPAHGTGRY